MHDILNQVIGHLRASWRYRWLALVMAWVISVGGWIHFAQMPDQYQSSARVHLDTDSILRPLLRGLAVEADVSQRVQLMTRTLLSQPNMEKLARMTDMHLRADSPASLERLTDQVRTRISIGSDRNQPNLFTISYRDTDPAKAQEVVQALLTIFMESTLGESRQDSDIAQRFIDRQIADYERRLEEAEQRLANFRRDNVGMLPGDRGSYYQRLQAIENQKEEAQLRLSEAENRRAELQRQLESESPRMEGQDSSIAWWQDTPTRLDSRIENLESQLDELLLRFTENHPDVISHRRTIEDLREQRDEELALRAEAMSGFGGGSAGSGQDNPMFQQIRMAISGADAEIASLRVRVAEFERQGERLRNMVDTIPQIEAEMQRLNRDYDVNKRQYEELLRRRETAQISQVAEDRGEQVQFRIVDPARLPRDPSGPDRPLYFAMSLFGGLGAGLGLAFLLSQVRPVFDNRRTLSEITGLPVLGTVSWVLTPIERTRARIGLAGFVMASAILLVVFGGVVMFEVTVHDMVTRYI